ncbi:MAG: amidohydrolase [Defluviitaleaceae bacterium]|nr:amidohydrolase [Defluviitaleaceae bacterium]
MNKILLKNAVVLTMDGQGTIHRNGFVLTAGDAVAQAGPMEALPQLDNCHVLDCSGKIVMPGMVNCHCHMSMITYRSLADDVPDRLNRFMLPLEARTMSEELVRHGTYYACAEMLLSGITTIVDHGNIVLTQAEAVADIGIRGVISENITSANFESSFTATREFLEKWSGHPLVRPSVTCHAPYSVSSEHMQAAHKLAREHGALMQMHLAEMVYEMKESREKYGISPVERLDKLGILDDKFLAAHACLASGDDLDIFAKRGVKVSYDPGANTKAAKDIAPVMEMQARGITVGLGTDGPMSNNALNVLSQMPLAARCQKIKYKDRSAFPCEHVVRMGTIEGAKAACIDHLTGSIEAGKKADIVILETDSPNMSPIYDYYGAIVYSANASNVESTIVNGRLVVHNKRLLTKDFASLRKDLLSHHEKISAVADELCLEMSKKYDLTEKLNY